MNRFYVILCSVSLCTGAVQAQTIRVKETFNAADGEALPGVTTWVKVGTIAAADGYFSISLDRYSTSIFLSIGYTTVDVQFYK